MRDVEYASRRERVAARAAANPERPLTVALGSSRTDFGIRPLASDAGPLLANASQVGAGPLLQLLTLKRLLHDGIRPAAAIVEFWPPFLIDSSASRIDPHRLFASDEPFVREFLPNPEETLRLMREIRRTPVWNHRQRLVSRLLPSLLPVEQRLDGGAPRLDAAGWLPGSTQHSERSVANAGKYYQPILKRADFDVSETRALRELLIFCRANHIAVTLLWMPESSEFRSWYPPDTFQKADAFLKSLKVPIIVARDWMSDDEFSDGYHLTPAGAAVFTRRLTAALAE